MSEDPELDELRQKRQAEIQKQLAEKEQQEEAKSQYEMDLEYLNKMINLV